MANQLKMNERLILHTGQHAPILFRICPGVLNEDAPTEITDYCTRVLHCIRTTKRNPTPSVAVMWPNTPYFYVDGVVLPTFVNSCLELAEHLYTLLKVVSL